MSEHELPEREQAVLDDFVDVLDAREVERNEVDETPERDEEDA